MACARISEGRKCSLTCRDSDAMQRRVSITVLPNQWTLIMHQGADASLARGYRVLPGWGVRMGKLFVQQQQQQTGSRLPRERGRTK